MLRIDPSFILIDFNATDAEHVIQELCLRLQEAGSVGEGYARATIAREQAHPTGLPTSPFCIAFPHADSEGVHSSSLAVASVQDPVVFKNMADPSEDLQVEMIFLLANRNPEEQVQTLRRLATIFGQSEKLEHLRSIRSEASAVEWLEAELIAID